MKRKASKEERTYLNGVARRPHVHTCTLERSFEEESEASSSSASNPVACPQCFPVLSCYSPIIMTNVNNKSVHIMIGRTYPIREKSQMSS